MASVATFCVNNETSPFLLHFCVGFFSAEMNLKHGFLPCETFTGATWLQHHFAAREFPHCYTVINYTCTFQAEQGSLHFNVLLW